jgi:hypothetical protein
MAEIEKELTEKEKKILEESLAGKREEALKAWNEIKEVFTKMAQTVIDWFNNFRKNLDEAADKGDPNAQYVKATLELATWEKNLKEVEAKLKYTKKTTARKPLIEEQKICKAQVEKYKQLQIEALEKIGTND